MLRQIGNQLGPYSVTPEELARLRENVRAGKLGALGLVFPGDGADSLVRFHTAGDADRALEIMR